MEDHDPSITSVPPRSHCPAPSSVSWRHLLDSCAATSRCTRSATTGPATSRSTDAVPALGIEAVSLVGNAFLRGHDGPGRSALPQGWPDIEGLALRLHERGGWWR